MTTYTERIMRGSVQVARLSVGEIREACDALMSEGMPPDAAFNLIDGGIDGSAGRVAATWAIDPCEATGCYADGVRLVSDGDSDGPFCDNHDWDDVDID